MNILIVMPAKDEVMNIAFVLQDLLDNGWHDILVVDDFSVDATAGVARKLGAKVMNLPIHLGAWGAIQAGMRYAVKNNYDAVVTIDADGQHKAKDVDALVQALDGKDIVTGSSPERGGLWKKIIWRFMRKISGLSFSDLTSGFRAYSKEAMMLLIGYESMLLDYQCVGVLQLCQKKGLKTWEVSVTMDARNHGTSKVFKNFFEIIRYLFSTFIHLGAKRW